MSFKHPFLAKVTLLDAQGNTDNSVGVISQQISSFLFTLAWD